MWNNDEEVDENGTSVKVYSPIMGSLRRQNTALKESHIGGLAHEQDAPSCEKCQESMFLLAQLTNRKVAKPDGSLVDRFVCVFACPRSSCCAGINFDHGFSIGSQGVMSITRVEVPVEIKETPAVPAAPAKSSWYTDGTDEDDNDWGMDVGTSGAASNDMTNLEDAVSKMEDSLDNGALVKQTKPKASSKPISKKSSDTSKTFACYLLNEQNEPPAPRQVEEDDVGLSASDDKIRNMLARYMAEEEDEDILAALKGTEMGSGMGEEDERLSEEDRVFLGFQDRLRRVPRQVIRFARGGVPIWSIPGEAKDGKSLCQVPPCPCGAERVFEFQLLPSLLHLLEVDKFSGESNNSGNENDKNASVGIGDMLSNGMNWGSVAVFTCRNDCGSCKDALVIQKSVDEGPDVSHIGLPSNYENNGMDAGVAVVEAMDDDDDFEPDV